MNLQLALTAIVSLLAFPTCAQFSPGTPSSKATRGDGLLTEYLQAQVTTIADHCLEDVNGARDWIALRQEYRQELMEMLGLWPMPERTELHPVITGRLEAEEFTVENLYFQASPRLYCTANLYIPKGIEFPAPTVLYECGHWKYITNGVSYGNKAVYQIDGAWYARNGYVCMVMDTLLAGEIQGIHTGTRDNGLWWWNSRGYTPAGVEAWFGIRALDYLCSRPEVDSERIGITGHSGGGAYSWSVTALDDRIKVAAPLAGMTDLQHHIMANLMDSHCDCNFPVNFYRWDFPQLAAMAAPRPLLIGGTDNDGIFPLEGTIDIYDQVRKVYKVSGATDDLGLIIAPGPHDEVPELRLAVMRWFNRYLKGLDRESEPPILIEAKPFFTPDELRVFESLPDDAINATIASTFVPMAKPLTRSAAELGAILLQTVFAGWPATNSPNDPKQVFSVDREGLRLSAWDFLSQEHVPLRLYLLSESGGTLPKTIELRVLDNTGWTHWLATAGTVFSSALTDELTSSPAPGSKAEATSSLKQEVKDSGGALAFLAPRGIGLGLWSGDAKRQTRIRRRFMLLGQTVDGMRVWDIRRAVQMLQALEDSPYSEGAVTSISLRSEGTMGVNALYAALFEPGVAELLLTNLPQSHSEGPDYLNVLKVTDIPEVTNAVGSRCNLILRSE